MSPLADFLRPITVIALEVILFYSYTIYIIYNSKHRRYTTVLYTFFISTGVCATLTGVSKVSHIFGDVVAASSGFTAVRYYRRYNQIFSLSNIRKLIFAQYLISFGTHLHRLVFKVEYNEELQRLSAVPFLYTDTANMTGRVFYFILDVLYLSMGIVMNLYTLYKLSQLGIRTANQTRVVLFSCICFITTIPNSTYNIVKLFAMLFHYDEFVAGWLSQQYSWCVYTLMFSNPISIFLLSSDLRSELFHIRFTPNNSTPDDMDNPATVTQVKNESISTTQKQTKMTTPRVE